MPMIGQKERDFLTKEFSEKLVKDVRLVIFTQEVPCRFCSETVEVATEIAQVSPKIKLEVYDFVRDQTRAKEFRIDKIPAIAIIGSKDYGIRFYGIPSGYEFASLVGAIIDVSKGDSGLSPKSRDLLKNIDQSIHIQVFVTPTCPTCPTAVKLAHRLAIESDMIWSDMVESTEFVPLAQKYGVFSVPKIIINDREEITGSLPEDLFVAHVLNSITHTEPLQPR
jgi:glutaredoxin-like protein